MKNLITLTLVLALTGCVKNAVSTDKTNNPNIQVDKLFTHEGCSVYRFMDNGYYQYFADCRGSVSTHHSCGKNCTHEDEVTTSD